MNDRYHNLSFSISVNKLAQLPADDGYEVAFAGRSNAGKSSAINAITQNKKLARISKTPGRTQLINYFNLDSQHRVVDLPGYGYAKVPQKIKQHWQELINAYLTTRQSLMGIVLLMDIRHPLKAFDEQLLSWCASVGMPTHILLTKSDKLKPNPAKNALFTTRRDLHKIYPQASIQLFSATNSAGLPAVTRKLDEWLHIGEDGSKE